MEKKGGMIKVCCAMCAKQHTKQYMAGYSANFALLPVTHWNAMCYKIVFIHFTVQEVV